MGAVKRLYIFYHYFFVRSTIAGLLITLLTFSNSFGDSKKAFKLLEKGEYDKLVEHLDKSIEKDSINAGARYVFSLLYLTTEFRDYNIDKAYNYINEAITDLPRMDEKDIDQLNKIGINDSALLAQKKEVQHRAFERATSLHSIDDYNYFLDFFNEASHVDSATALRNYIAYEDAVEANTYEAFYAFMNTYPQARELEKATAKYEELLYHSRTGDQRLENFERFVKNNPDSPFRDKAEKNIFEIATADNQMESYLAFIEKYPDSKQIKRAKSFLYHTYKQSASSQQFSNRFDFLSKEDSLYSVVQSDIGYLIPIYEMGKYGFILENGRKLIDFAYTDIHEHYLCGNIHDDILEVWLDSKHLLVSRLGVVIFDTSFESVEDLGVGVLKVEHMNRFGVIHKSGNKVLDINYEAVGLVANAFVKFKQNGRWGLITLTGREVLKPEYDDIISEGDFILLQKGDLMAVENVETLSGIVNLEHPNIQLIYDDFELINASQMLLFSGNREAIINKDLEEKIPLDDHQIFELFDGWYVKKNNKIRVYDQIFKEESNEEFNAIIHSGKKAALKRGKQWSIFHQGKIFPTQFIYDSIQFLSEKIGILIEGKNTFALFENDSLIDISDTKEIRLLMDRSLSMDEMSGSGQYLSTKTAKGNYRVYDTNGRVILDGRYNSVEAMGNEYLIMTKSGKTGLVHQSGEVALKVKYKAIGNYDNGYVSTLLNGKFGIYNYKGKILLSAKYGKRLKPYGTDYFVGSKGQKLALIDRDNAPVSGFRFEEVQFWNDSIALVKEKDLWHLYDIKNDEITFQPISEFTYLRNEEDHKLLLITCKSGNGVLSSRLGEVIAPTFNDIVNVGSKDQPVYFAEKYIREAEFYVIIYYDEHGNILRKQVFNQEEYDNIYCG